LVVWFGVPERNPDTLSRLPKLEKRKPWRWGTARMTLRNLMWLGLKWSNKRRFRFGNSRNG
jgi:hypothetical protein